MRGERASQAVPLRLVAAAAWCANKVIRAKHTSFGFPAGAWRLHFKCPPSSNSHPSSQTRRKQVQMWLELISSYCRAHSIFEIDVNDSAFPLWQNERIKRKLSITTIRHFLDEIVAQGIGEWIDKERTKVLLLWKKPEEWANIFIKWAHNSGMRDGIFTLYELRTGENTVGEEFHGLDQRIILKALQIVERQGKARIFSASTGDIGVKFSGNV